MLFNVLYRLRGLAMVLGVVALMLALTACSNPPPTDPGDEPDTPQPIPGNDNGDPQDPTDQADQDGDGVLDDADDCPGTAPGTLVDEAGCPMIQPGAADDDEDGVPNGDDDCLETPEGERNDVDAAGCGPSERDTDGDNVFDIDDDCPATPAGDQADENGCGESQRDTDGDLVVDTDDRCPATPDGEEVDDNGCAAGQLEQDTDGDEVLDPDDLCPGTPAGEEVDADGCSMGQRDTDGDDVPNAVDQCARTPEGEPVDENGCAASQRDSDDDGVYDDVDQCSDTERGVSVDEVGCPLPDDNGNGNGNGNGGGGETPVCGNEVVEEGEQCDPPDGVDCDDNCQSIGGPANDNCANPATVNAGTITINNTDATTDGPDEVDSCNFFDYTHIESDVWYCYTATCTGAVTVSLCGSRYDTKMAVYAGCDCPTDAPVACSDDNCGISVESRVRFGANEGDSFLIRVGGFAGEQGDGYLTIFCGDGPTCGEGAGNCFEANGSPACEDVDCCNAVCGIDQYCCDVDWDERCADVEAEGLCGGVFPPCVDGAGDCEGGLACAGGADDGQPCTEDADCLERRCERDPGCDHQDCCQTVCFDDPFCCLTSWDSVCVDAATQRCAMFDVCPLATESCFSQHHEPGCSDEDCCLLVCEMDPLCCTDEWDEVCVQRAAACRQ